MPTVSVVLPNFNHATELETSLLAIATQTLPADEIIVIDDGSTDASVAVIEGFAARFPAIRLLRSDQRGGVAAAVSRGVAAARGDYIVLASADEKMLPCMIERLSAAASRFPEARLVVSSYAQWWPDKDEIRVHGPESELGPWYLASPEATYISAERLHDLLKQWFVWLGTNTAMFARDALLAVGVFDAALKWHSDWFAIYAIAFKHGFVVVPESLALFRMVESSYSIGMRQSSMQCNVALAIQHKLRDPRFAYFRAAVTRSPAVMSTFMRETILALLSRPVLYPMLLALLRWWLVEVLRGRRPGAWARLLHGGELPQPRPGVVLSKALVSQ